MKYFLFACFIPVCIISAYSQINSKGIYGSFINSYYEADFRQTGLILDTLPRVGYGKNLDFGFGAFYTYPLSRKVFLGWKISLQYQKLLLENSRNYFLNGENAVSTLAFNEKIISFITSSYLGYNILSKIHLLAGIDFGYNFTLKSSFTEIIRTVNNQVSFLHNAFPPSKIPYSFTFDIGLSYHLPFRILNLIQPAVNLSYNFGYTLAKDNFTIDRKSLHFSLRLSLESPQKSSINYNAKSEPMRRKDTSVIKQLQTKFESDTFKIDYVGISDEKIYPPVLSIQNYPIENYFPLLNYIFFDYTKAEIPKRYKKLSKEQISQFSLNSLDSTDQLEVYYNILNIIGYRMREFLNSKLLIVGCNSNIGEENGNIQLSKRRAENIARYFIEFWEIDTHRLHIEYKNLPDKYSNPKTNEGAQENQRVELYSEEKKLLSPLTIFIYEKKIVPEVIRFYFRKNNKQRHKQLQQISIKLFTSNKIIYSLDTLSTTLIDSLDINLNEVIGEIEINHPIDFTIQVHENMDSTKLVQTTNGSIPTINDIYHAKKIRKDKKKIDLILFDFDSSKLNEHQLYILKEFRHRLLGADKICIIGYTDKIGEKFYNKKLSFERAKSVADELTLTNPTILGMGEEKELFNNSLPEGRYYSRMVSIIIEYN